MKKIFLFAIAIVLMSCTTNNGQNDDQTGSKPNVEKQVSLSLNIFTGIPQEIDGCACYFYLSEEDRKQNKYICVNDFANRAFVSVNGKLEQFELKEHKQNDKVYLYYNKSMELRIEITKKTDGGEETSNVEGIIKIIKEDKKTERNFIGSCGC